MLVVCRCSGVTCPCRANEHSRDRAAWCQKSWRKRWQITNLLWSACLPFFWPNWALQWAGAGWEARTWCCILSSQALGLPLEVLFGLELMGYFYLTRPLDSMSFLPGVGRAAITITWLEFGCCLLLPALALCSAFWDTKDAASQLPELFSGVHIMSGLSVFLVT